MLKANAHVQVVVNLINSLSYEIQSESIRSVLDLVFRTDEEFAQQSFDLIDAILKA